MSPGVGAVRIDPNREVEIEANRHSLARRNVAAFHELPVGKPLKIFDEAALLRFAFSHIRQGAGLCSCQRLGPLTPGPARITGAQDFKGAEFREAFAALASEGLEVIAPLTSRRALEALVSQAQGLGLEESDARIVDERRLAATLRLPLKLCIGLEAWHPIDRDVERVEE